MVLPQGQVAQWVRLGRYEDWVAYDTGEDLSITTRKDLQGEQIETPGFACWLTQMRHQFWQRRGQDPDTGA